MNKAFEKILERLEETKDIAQDDSVAEIISTRIWNKAIHIAKEIVQEVAEEYNDGWIPCSERLPEIDGNTSHTVLVCGSNGFRYMAFWCDDLQWRFCECGMAKEPVLWTEIVAWQPLPESYKDTISGYCV